MLPKIIIHNVVSLNGSLTGFDPNIEKYYEIARTYKHDAVLVGSNTAKAGLEMFYDKITPEKKSDFKKPILKSDDKTPLWIIPDSRGILQNKLHVIRQSGYCKDIIVLISKKTSKSYINYLKERNYDYILTGEDHVNYKQALEIIYDKYNVKAIRMDSGGTLNSILLSQGLVDKISILLSPVIVSKSNNYLIKKLNKASEKGKIDLNLIKNKIVDKNHVLLIYKVIK
ncbi:5-amino-6-(5-phosphoribosylamino)uracil reductase [Thermoplasmatales archaeon SG8-52-4]|nr:MAG: 5-amino-6-(5-phosphoribosylamino)uracil reductase [Thermoplasmatales archaeon SG8-52-4]